MMIVQQSEWPKPDYDKIRQAVYAMVDGETIAVDVLDEAKIEDVRKCAQRYAREVLHCRQNGWELITSQRGNTLFINRRHW
jgi:TusA-related sulfurtransferase